MELDLVESTVTTAAAAALSSAATKAKVKGITLILKPFAILILQSS